MIKVYCPKCKEFIGYLEDFQEMEVTEELCLNCNYIIKFNNI